MHDQRISAALERIDRALARLEAQGTIRPASEEDSAELARLRAAHNLLRSRVENAIGEIDRMLESA